MRTTFIYALKELKPGEFFSTKIRYIGKADDPYDRFDEHVNTKEKNHRGNWIRSLTAKGLSLQLEILDEVPFDVWEFWEKEYIKVFRAVGFPLVNGTDGGEGGATMLGKKFAPAHRAAISAGLKGKKKTPEWCARISAGKLGTKLNLSPKALQKRIDDATGRVHSPESCAKRRKKKSTASSKFYGVSKFRGVWRARVVLHCKEIHLGCFSTELDAARTYDTAAKKYHGEHAVLNFP